MGAGESRFLDVSTAAHRTLLGPLAIFEKYQKRRSPPHSITARHTGSRGKHRNRVTTWSCRSTGLPDGQISKNLSSPLCKNISVFPKYKSGYMNSHPVHRRGALRNVTSAGRDAVDAEALSDEGR